MKLEIRPAFVVSVLEPSSSVRRGIAKRITIASTWSMGEQLSQAACTWRSSPG